MKRLVICADGTWNVRDQISKDAKTRHPTNVTKVTRAVLARDSSGIDQVAYYHDGVGTGSGLDKYSGGAFGNGIENNIRDLYRFILYNYLDGDELFLFGFSRGAFTVRTLTGFMNMVGLIQKDDDYFIPEVYACYESEIRLATVATGLRQITEFAPLPPPIKFVGVWDTVGALGAPGFLGQFVNRKKYQYHDVGFNRYIRNAYHALAIDERRKPFQPNTWQRVPDFAGNLEQAWFAGVHSNVGGSCSPDGLANEALHWIVEKAEGLGLAFDKEFLTHYKPCFNSVLQDSMTTVYKLLGPYIRPIGRQPPDGESIHQSAIDRLKDPPSAYAPENLKAYLASTPAPRTSNTERISRGTPC
ncbi:MAG TPA: hypothetical protein DEV93_21825 [Chloroflexi bacterium]|jgi:uncharacterized protein (DUF2235 family)|nr:hypothetical protein [Chloroflexota bacterium]